MDGGTVVYDRERKPASAHIIAYLPNVQPNDTNASGDTIPILTRRTIVCESDLVTGANPPVYSLE